MGGAFSLFSRPHLGDFVFYMPQLTVMTKVSNAQREVGEGGEDERAWNWQSHENHQLYWCSSYSCVCVSKHAQKTKLNCAAAKEMSWELQFRTFLLSTNALNNFREWFSLRLPAFFFFFFKWKSKFEGNLFSSMFVFVIERFSLTWPGIMQICGNLPMSSHV